ncbi:hypothetical protein AB0M95_40565 [Sphaerisporangium sp. NPDC051017]|uniref:hypothetical protein n=1 Tax=Sphaerisporangium sp. NPDC051017 TaxID=3154636 RepID=UPI0034232F4D
MLTTTPNQKTAAAPRGTHCCSTTPRDNSSKDRPPAAPPLVEAQERLAEIAFASEAHTEVPDA